MKRVLLFASIAIILASCSKPKFELEVNIHNNRSLIDKKFVITQFIDGNAVYSDTTKIKKDRFLLKIPYKGSALINITIPMSNINNILMVAEEGRLQLNIDGSKSILGGTVTNERIQAFYNENDSISLIFDQMDKEYELKLKSDLITPQVNDEYTTNRRELLKENTDRIIAFIRENIDNPIGEYYFMTRYKTMPYEKKLEMNGFATEKLRKEFGIQ